MKAKSTRSEDAKAKRIADAILKGYQELCEKRRAQREELLKSSHELTRKLERMIKVPKRDLSQIRFPHWWRDGNWSQRREETGITIEEEKAAMWYEAARRR